MKKAPSDSPIWQLKKMELLLPLSYLITKAEAHFASQSILLFGNPLHCYLLLKRTVSFKLACYSLLLNTLCFSRAEHTLQPNTLCKVTIYSSALFALLPFAQKNSFLQIGLLQFAS
jgi:hypothetical protein